jgi:hypothetical protein
MRRIGTVLGIVLFPVPALARVLTLQGERPLCVHRPGERSRT